MIQKLMIKIEDGGVEVSEKSKKLELSNKGMKIVD